MMALLPTTFHKGYGFSHAPWRSQQFFLCCRQQKQPSLPNLWGSGLSAKLDRHMTGKRQGWQVGATQSRPEPSVSGPQLGEVVLPGFPSPCCTSWLLFLPRALLSQWLLSPLLSLKGGHPRDNPASCLLPIPTHSAHPPSESTCKLRSPAPHLDDLFSAVVSTVFPSHRHQLPGKPGRKLPMKPPALWAYHWSPCPFLCHWASRHQQPWPTLESSPNHFGALMVC